MLQGLLNAPTATAATTNKQTNKETGAEAEAEADTTNTHGIVLIKFMKR